MAVVMGTVVSIKPESLNGRDGYRIEVDVDGKTYPGQWIQKDWADQEGFAVGKSVGLDLQDGGARIIGVTA